MNCEIEFLAVGDKSRAGDAIIVRYGEEANYQLMVIDGGTTDTGEAMVAHLKAQYTEQVTLQHVVLTHSDADHASGLRELLREIPVQNVWLHIPWFLSAEAITLFEDKTWTKEKLSAAIKKEYDIVSEILDLAWEKKCTVHYPFAGETIGPFTVLSPSRNRYLYLLPQFEKTPTPDQALIEVQGMWIGKTSMIARLLQKALAKAQTWTTETWATERLKDGGVTGASNESSVILYANLGDQRLLLTGDAGINALSWAIQYANGAGLALKNFSFVQIPHHGSRRNVGPTVLNALLGPIQPEGTKLFSAFVSAPIDDENHPRKIVLNAFMRRGGRVVATQGVSKVHRGGFAIRPGYSAAEVLEFSTNVEEYT